MYLIKKEVRESRPDAVLLTRIEKMAIILFDHTATNMDDFLVDLADRLDMVENGKERMKELSEKADNLFNDLVVTIPRNQRKQLQNTISDYEMRLAPKFQPSMTTVIMEKEEFRDLVDCARAKCMECTLDDHECEKCRLYKLLTSILPLEDYHDTMLCPYNVGKWGN